MSPTQALPSGSGAACDSTAIAIHTRAGTTTKTSVTAPATVTAGVATSITLSNNANGFFGFLMYVTSDVNGGVTSHVGRFQAAPAGSRFCTANNQAGTPQQTTLCHTAATQQTTLTATWIPPAAGTYTLVATVAEAGNGVPPLFDVRPVTINVVAAAAPTQAATVAPTVAATTAPTTATKVTTTAPTTAAGGAATTAPTTPVVATTAPTDATTTTTTAPTTTTAAPPTKATTTVQQAFATVIVKLQAVLNGTGSVAALKAAIQNLIAQIQAAVQKAKAAQNKANPNAAVTMIVTKAPAGAGLAAAAASAGSSYQIGFQNMEDAKVFAQIVRQASDPSPSVRAQSTLAGSGDLASQIQADPNAVNPTSGDPIIQQDQQFTTVTCPDGLIVSQDMQALCGTAPAAAGPAMALSNGAFIGIIIGGAVFLLLVIGGIMYYQRAKSTKTTVAPRV